MIDTGARFVNDIFLYTDGTARLENYINHSFKPNLLYHCGICFAKENISKYTELTVDYKYVLAKGDAVSFADSVTGEVVDGMDDVECLKQSTSELLNILNCM
jgi:hypothetical protein